MSGQSPSTVLYNALGIELDVQDNASFVAGQSALLVAGINPTNQSAFALTNTVGALGASLMSDSQTVQSAATVTTSGSFTMTEAYDGIQEFALVVSVGTVTGSGSIQYTIREFDPTSAGSGVYGNSATTVVINSSNAPGVFTAVLNTTTSTIAKVTWTVTGTFSATISSVVITKATPSSQAVTGTVAISGGTVTANQGTPNSLNEAWPITITDGYGNIQGSQINPIWVEGTINASNPSVGLDANPALAYDTQVGGKTTTAAPTYVNGNLDALSLTTLGGLRIDGVYASGTSSATAADVGVSGGYATTAAPTYATGTLNALSLTLAGSLRVDGTGGTFNNSSVGADAAAALAFDTQVGGRVTTAAPTYVTGNLDSLSLTTLGGLRIDGVYAAGTANATAADVMNSGGYVTTAAPTYTTGQLEPLSLDTAGNLRVTGTGGTFNNSSVGTDGAAALGFDTQVGAKVITTVPTYVTGNLQALTMDVGGNLRVVTNKASTSNVTSVTATTASQTLLAANLNRVFAAVYNGGTRNVYILLGAGTASPTNYTIVLLTGSYWEIPVDYIGQIDAIWATTGAAALTGSALVTELTP
jgi:hypothetical protein